MSQSARPRLLIHLQFFPKASAAECRPAGEQSKCLKYLVVRLKAPGVHRAILCSHTPCPLLWFAHWQRQQAHFNCRSPSVSLAYRQVQGLNLLVNFARCLAKAQGSTKLDQNASGSDCRDLLAEVEPKYFFLPC
jgi:hypothetical protein